MSQRTNLQSFLLLKSKWWGLIHNSATKLVTTIIKENLSDSVSLTDISTMELVPDWQEIVKEVHAQHLNMETGRWDKWPDPTGEFLTLDEFIRKYGGVRSENTTIAEPPVANWIAKVDEETNMWFSIPFDELYQNYES